MPLVHAVARQEHYAHHLDAIWDHLPNSIRGTFSRGRFPKKPPAGDVVMVAGEPDLCIAADNPTIYVEHGAGQTYADAGARVAKAYGGPFPAHVIGYIAPRQEKIRAAGIPGFAAGAPICDPYPLYVDNRCVAFTWHWDAASVSPEARTALPHYLPHLSRIVEAFRDAGWEVLGHRHPRLRGYTNLWDDVNVPEVGIRTLRERASCLVADNTSLMYEMSYLNRGVVALNAPWYRRDIDHGLRFWDCIPGIQLDDADELIDAVRHNYIPEFGNMWVNRLVYDNALSDGCDGLRAASWVTTLVAGM